MTTKGEKTIVALLAVIAGVLVVRLLGHGEAVAVAQGIGPEGPTPPTVVGGSIRSGANFEYIYRYWSDGRVDRTYTIFTVPCSIDSTCTVGIVDACFGDKDWDGFVDVNDLNNVIVEWGMCAEPTGQP